MACDMLTAIVALALFYNSTAVHVASRAHDGSEQGTTCLHAMATLETVSLNTMRICGRYVNWHAMVCTFFLSTIPPVFIPQVFLDIDYATYRFHFAGYTDGNVYKDFSDEMYTVSPHVAQFWSMLVSVPVVPAVYLFTRKTSAWQQLVLAFESATLGFATIGHTIAQPWTGDASFAMAICLMICATASGNESESRLYSWSLASTTMCWHFISHSIALAGAVGVFLVYIAKTYPEPKRAFVVLSLWGGMYVAGKDVMQYYIGSREASHTMLDFLGHYVFMTWMNSYWLFDGRLHQRRD